MMSDVPGPFDGELGTVIEDHDDVDMLPVGTARAAAAGSLVLRGAAPRSSDIGKGQAKGQGYGRLDI